MINAKIELALARVFFSFLLGKRNYFRIWPSSWTAFLEIRERGEEIEEVGQRGRRNDCVGKPGGHLIHHRAKNKLRPEKDFPRGEKRSADREQTGVGPSRGSSKGWRIPFASSILEKGKMFALLRGRDVSTNALPPKFHSEQTVYRSFLSLSLSLVSHPLWIEKWMGFAVEFLSRTLPPFSRWRRTEIERAEKVWTRGMRDGREDGCQTMEIILSAVEKVRSGSMEWLWKMFFTSSRLFPLSLSPNKETCSIMRISSQINRRDLPPRYLSSFNGSNLSFS